MSSIIDSKEIDLESVDMYPTLSQVIDILLDEVTHPCTRLIQPPLLATQILPIIVRGRLNLMISWKKYTDGKIEMNDMAGEILAYAALILSIGTGIRNGDYTSAVFADDPDVRKELFEINAKIAHGIRCANIAAVLSSQWRMGEQHIFFGDISNTAGISIRWRHDDSLYSKKMYWQELMKNDDNVEGEN